LAFNVFVYITQDSEAAVAFLTAYTIERLLSVDNLFVFAVIFTFFAVPEHLQHRVLFWGILSALAMRALFLFGGLLILQSFAPAIFIFGGFLLFTALRLAREGEGIIDVQTHPVMRLARRLRTLPTYDGSKFITIKDGKRYGTPLLLCLVLVEGADIVFAVDSVPAVVSISRDPFIVYSSNVFAILGLRAMYFLLASAIRRFHYLKPMLAVILGFIGLKMILDGMIEFVPGAPHLQISTGLSLVVVLVLLVAAVALSKAYPPAGWEESVHDHTRPHPPPRRKPPPTDESSDP